MLLQHALDRYQGDFLAGFTVRDAPTFEEWALTRQEQLRELALHGLHNLVIQYTLYDDYRAAIRASEHLLAVDPWREEAHRQQMLLLAHSGQPQAALAQYQRCLRVLADELGIEPMPETTELYERILASQAEKPRPIALPATSFVGRDAERMLIRQQLSNPQDRLITILGQGGVGKSRLSLQVAIDHQQRFLHGVAIVLLAPVTSADLLVPTIAGALGLTFQRATAPAAQLIDYLRGKELLLVLDNFEQLVEEGSSLVMDILRSAPQVKLLVTSRERLRLQEEWLIELEGLPLPSDDAELENAGALRLFVDRTRQIQPSFDPQHSEWQHIHMICRLAGGLPLAIELAASAMRAHTCAEIAREMARNEDFLQTTVRNIPERQRSMRATFEYSWQLLSPAEQTAFRRASVFRGGFDREAADAIVGTALLAALADKSLLYRARSGRYGVHELLRQYAEEKLGMFSEDYVATRDRHMRWVATLLDRQRQRLHGLDQQAALEAIDAELENVRHAWQWGIERADADAIDLTLDGYYHYYEMSNRFQEGVDAFTAASTRFAAIPEPDTSSRLVDKLLARQAVLLHRLGDYERARDLLRHSLHAARQHHDLRELAFCSDNLGYVIYDLGGYTEARLLFEESAQCYRELHDMWNLAAVLTNLGLVGTVHEQIARLQESRALCEEIGDRRTLARVLNNLGALICAQGRYGEARELYSKSLTIFEEIRYRRGMAYVMYQLSTLNGDTGDYAAGWGFGQRSLALFGEIGEQRGVALCYSNLATLATYRGEFDEARRMLHHSLSIARQLGDQYIQVHALDQLGTIAEALGKVAEACHQHHEALTIARTLGDESTVATVLVNVARATALAGDPSQAHTYLRDALAIAVERQIVTVALEVLYNLAVLVQENEPVGAVEQLTVVVEHAASFHETRAKARHLLDHTLARLTPDEAVNAIRHDNVRSLDQIAAQILKE